MAQRNSIRPSEIGRGHLLSLGECPRLSRTIGGRTQTPTERQVDLSELSVPSSVLIK
jgi:hypothetical protein